MKWTTLYCGALSACVVIALAVLFGCDDSGKRVTTITPPSSFTPHPAAATPATTAPSAITRLIGLGPRPTAAEPAASAGSPSTPSGALTALAGLPVAGNLQCPEFMAFDPAQKFLFVPDESSEEIHSYAIAVMAA